MKRITFSLAVVFSFTLASPIARGATNPSLEAGINLFQQGKLDEAKTKFLELLKEPQWEFAGFYNLGNIAARQKHFGEAAAYMRLALNKNPHDSDAHHNLTVIQNNLSSQRAGPPSNFEILRTSVLDRFTMNEGLLVTLIGFLGFLTSLTRYLRQRKTLLADDREAKLPPPSMLFIVGFILLLFLSTATLKLIDTYTERGTIVTAKTELKSGPNNTNASMADVPEGAEVQIQDATQGWKQITVSGGLTGWVPDTAIIETSGGGPW